MIQLQREFAEIIEYPYAQEFYMMLYHCCNYKNMYLLRDLGQHILPVSQCFDFLIYKTFDDDYFQIKMHTQLEIQLEFIPANGSPLELDHIMRCSPGSPVLDACSEGLGCQSCTGKSASITRHLGLEQV